MAIALIERPYKFGFSKNEARYVFTVSNPLSVGCAVEIKLFCHTITSATAPPELIVSMKLYPTPDGVVRFYAESYFESILQLHMPAPGSTTAVQAINQQRYYWIEYRQITDISPNNAWVITERDRKRVMLLGGVEVQKFERNNFFTNYIIPNKLWLTWLPDNRFVGLNQEHYLSWLRNADVAVTPYLRVDVFYTDGSTANKEIAIADNTKSFLFHLPAGVKQLGLQLLSPDKNIYCYTLTVRDETAGDLTVAYKFFIDYDHYYSYFDWVYLNSISGLDCIRIRGEQSREIDRDVSSVDSLNLSNEITDAIKESDTTDTGVLLTKKFKADVGYLNSAEEQDGIADVLSSIEVFELVNSRWFRIRLLTKTQTMGASGDTKWNFPLEWMYAWVNSVYTPDKKLFGSGNNTAETYDGFISACPAPTGLNADETGVASGVSDVEFTWAHPGNVLITIQTKEDGSTDWADTFTDTTGSSLFVAQFVADGRTMNWRLKLKCPNEDESVYVNGPDFTLTNAAAACAVPTGLSWTQGTPAAGMIPFTFNWAHALPAPDFKLEYRVNGTSLWTDVAVAGVTTTISFADDGKEYQWRLTALCAAGSVSVPVMGANFVSSSAITCTNPYSLTSTQIAETPTHKTIRFSWVHPGSTNFLFNWNSRAGNSGSHTPADQYIDIEFEKIEERIYWEVAAQCTIGNFSSYVNGFPVSL